MAHERPPVDGERLEQPVGMGAVARQKGRQSKGGLPVAEGRQRRDEAIPHIMRQAIGSFPS